MKILLPPLLLLLAAGCNPELVCPSGEADCDGTCVSLATDPAHCGACGAAVGPLGACVGGVAACDPRVDVCGGACVDTARDPGHCGGCDVVCDPAQLCTTDGSGTSCTASCPTGFTACDRACVDLDADRVHCGACGHGCEPWESCRAGSCRADLVVACYATNEVTQAAADLAAAGGARGTPSGPTSIAIHGDAVLSANGYPQASVSVLPFDLAIETSAVPVTGSDLQHLAIVDGVVVITNAGVGSLLFLSPSGSLLGELAMPDQQAAPNPHGFAVSGTTAYVALYGTDSGGGSVSGQSIARVDLDLAACAADPLSTPCGSVAGEIDLVAVAGSHDSPGLPFPSEVIEAAGKIYVTLANLQEGTVSCGSGCSFTAWAKPAGSGRVAVIDPSAGDAVTIVDLGAGCGNPGALALSGSTLWISCGSFSFFDLAPGVLVPVDLTQSPPLAGAPIAFGSTLPGKLAFCGGVGYVTDQGSGAVVRFDPVGRTLEAPVNICPMSDAGWAWASDVACVP